MIITSTGTTRRALTAQESNNVKEWLAININCLPKEITKNTWLSHLHMEQRLMHGEVDLFALAKNCGASPEVI